MEIFFPDIADNGERGLVLQPGTVAVCAKATEGHTFTDPSYEGFKAQAASIGAFFTAYHWLWPNDPAGQALRCLTVVGTGIEVMLDVEEETAICSVANIVEFVTTFRNEGGTCNEVYLPHWYWSGKMGSPSLQPLVDLGLLLVASDYRTYDPNNWPAPYGGMTPFRWQYTDAFPYGGHAVDFNAVRLDINGYRAAVGFPVPPTPPPTPQGDPMLTHWTSVQRGSTGSQVKVAQGVLIANGLGVGSPNGLPDGNFGPTTEASTRSLQSRHGIAVDGVFGPHTLSVGIYGHDYA